MEYYFVKFNNNKVHNDIQSWIKRPSEGSTVETVTQNANARKRTEGVHMVAILLYLNSPCSIY